MENSLTSIKRRKRLSKAKYLLPRYFRANIRFVTILWHIPRVQHDDVGSVEVALPHLFGSEHYVWRWVPALITTLPFSGVAATGIPPPESDSRHNIAMRYWCSSCSQLFSVTLFIFLRRRGPFIARWYQQSGYLTAFILHIWRLFSAYLYPYFRQFECIKSVHYLQKTIGKGRFPRRTCILGASRNM